MASVFVPITLLLSEFSIVRLEYGEFLYVLTGLPLLLGIVEVNKKISGSRVIFLVQVRFYYDPDSFKLGAIISVLSVVVWGGLALFPGRKKNA